MRVALAALFAAGVAGLVLLHEPASFLPALLAMALGFLLAAAMAAVDLIDLNPADLAADAITLLALATALTRITTGDALTIGMLLAVACAAQGFPRAVTMARCLRRSTSPRMPPGSA
jgi:hypothetical protein